MRLFNFFTRPSVTNVVRGELYEAQRERLNALAAVERAGYNVAAAKASMATAKAHLDYCTRRVASLQTELEQGPERQLLTTTSQLPLIEDNSR